MILHVVNCIAPEEARMLRDLGADLACARFMRFDRSRTGFSLSGSFIPYLSLKKDER
jgi:hypothetical protein